LLHRWEREPAAAAAVTTILLCVIISALFLLLLFPGVPANYLRPWDVTTKWFLIKGAMASSSTVQTNLRVTDLMVGWTPKYLTIVVGGGDDIKISRGGPGH